jgi:UDP-glucose 4-epimerase
LTKERFPVECTLFYQLKNKMRILVVGANGFVGSHCVTFLSREGHDVTGCDTKEERRKGYIALSDFKNDFNLLFEQNRFDVCINAAGSAHVNYSFQFPEKDFKLNVSLVIDLLGAIKTYSPACKFINFSSAAVYGNPAALPVAETAETKPLSPYGYHKLLSEKLLFEYSRFFDLKTCSLRVFSVYGPGLTKQLFWDLRQKALTDPHVELFGTGNESRDFIFIDDLVEVVRTVLDRSSFSGEVINVGSGTEESIRNAASLFLKEFAPNALITFNGKEKTGDPRNWRADISILKKMNFKTEVSLEEGLKKYVEWLRKLK